jgi:hypothetical protein
LIECKVELKTNDEICHIESERNDYLIYSLSVDDNNAIGDVMSYFDWDLNQLFRFYLKDIWNDKTHER